MSKKTIAGWVVTVLVCGVMILAGAGKVTGNPPEEVRTNLESIGLSEELAVIGALEILCALIFLIPRTSSIGLLLCCSFWGGAVVAHLSLGDNGYGPALVLGALTWLAAYLRVPGAFASLGRRTETLQADHG